MKDRRAMLDVIGKLSEAQHESSNDPEIPAKISQYEMAYRMMTSVPEVADISNEPESVLDMYGPDVRKPGHLRAQLPAGPPPSRARRAVHLRDACGLGSPHQHRCSGIRRIASTVDQPSAALVTDLKQRGLLKDTLVMWGSEFGRTSFAQGVIDTNVGRDHHGNNFVWWLAGGGVKPGFSYGETDDFSYNTVTPSRRDPRHARHHAAHAGNRS